MLPQEVGEKTKLQTGQICSQKIHRCIIRGLGCTLQHPYDDCGYKDIVRTTKSIWAHLASVTSTSCCQHQAKDGATGLVQGHFFHTSQSYQLANTWQDTPPSTLIQPGLVLFIFSKQIIKTKAYLFTFHQ